MYYQRQLLQWFPSCICVGSWGMFFPMGHGTFIVCFHIAQFDHSEPHGANHIFHRYILGFCSRKTILISNGGVALANPDSLFF